MLGAQFIPEAYICRSSKKRHKNYGILIIRRTFND